MPTGTDASLHSVAWSMLKTECRERHERRMRCCLLGCSVAFSRWRSRCSLPCTRSALGPFSFVSFQHMLIDVGLVTFDVPARGDPFRGRVMLPCLRCSSYLPRTQQVGPRARDADRARNTQRTRPWYAQRRQERLPDQRLRWATLRGGTLWEGQCSAALHTRDLLVSQRRTARGEPSCFQGHSCRLAKLTTKVDYQEQRRQRRPLPRNRGGNVGRCLGTMLLLQKRWAGQRLPYNGPPRRRKDRTTHVRTFSGGTRGVAPTAPHAKIGARSLSRTPLRRRRVANGTDTKRQHLADGEGKLLTANSGCCL